MKTIPTELPTELNSEERLPWHKPEVVLLTISVDTGQKPADFTTDLSGDDLED